MCGEPRPGFVARDKVVVKISCATEYEYFCFAEIENAESISKRVTGRPDQKCGGIAAHAAAWSDEA